MKFYVSTGDYNEIIVAPDVTEAALNLIEKIWDEGRPPEFGQIIRVSEVGFDDDGPGHDEDRYIAMDTAIKQLQDLKEREE